jgi:hypothetical protein
MPRAVFIATASSVFGVALLFPANAPAQQRASIVGVVQDSTGGVMPGVTVEASSPSLIERVRSAVTDGNDYVKTVDTRAAKAVRFGRPAPAGVHRALQRPQRGDDLGERNSGTAAFSTRR